MRLRDASAPATAPVSSATVMLVRDKAQGAGTEVFMLQRHGKADFGHAHVFPGGLAADGDYSHAMEPFCYGLDDREASRQLGLEAGGLGLWVAAIRECFEESGYLLARDLSGALCQPAADPHRVRFDDYRQALAGNALTLLSVCETESLSLMCDAIEYVSFWTTPVVFERRYATRFFVAAVPEGQYGIADGTETIDAIWVCPAAAIDPAVEPRLTLHPPTVENLRWLAGFDSVAETMAAARALDKTQIEEVLPVVSRDDAGMRVILPDGRVATP